MQPIYSIESLTLDLPPSCVAFCPTQPEYFIVGTYYLHPNEQPDPSADVQAKAAKNADTNLGDLAQSKRDPQTRSGSLILFRLDGETIRTVITKTTNSAILDAQWTPHSQQLGHVLAVATSTGVIAFYRLERKDGSADLVLLSQNEISDDSVLILSLAWHPYHSNVLGVTLSNGNVSLCSNIGNAVNHIHEVFKHDLEAWTLAFVDEEATTVLSGGDDIVLQCSSVENQNECLLWSDRKLHQAGVTAILPLSPNLIVTGSYDDHIRLISLPPGSRRQIEAKLNLGGGVWRLKLLDPTCRSGVEGTARRFASLSNIESLLILASCMHAGSHIVRLCKNLNEDWMFDVVGKFEEHQSMNYGSDVQPSPYSLKSIVSTSFYDKLLCLWQFDMDGVEMAR